MEPACKTQPTHPTLDTRRAPQVKRALLDPDGKWLLEGAIRQPQRTAAERKQEAPFTPWNLGVYDALVLADKMTGCPGGWGRGAGGGCRGGWVGGWLD
jgi:hypothetical protein